MATHPLPRLGADSQQRDWLAQGSGGRAQGLGGARDVTAPAPRTPLPEGRAGPGGGRGAGCGLGRQASKVETCAPRGRAGAMTLFHFGNCFALAYFPYFITYKCSGLSEYNAFWKCVQAGVTYLFVQLCKMLFLATFFPTWEGGIYDFIGEFMKASVDVADLVGLNLVMSRNAGKGEYKIMVAALGWATAELIMSRCIPLWVGARGIEFDWKYIQMSIDSNISLVHYIVASAQVWMITRYDLYHTFRPAVLLLMFFSVYKAFVMETFVHLCSLGSWTALLARAVVTGLLALSTLALYVAVVNVHS